MENRLTTSPSWTEIFKEIGIQLKTRSGLLTRRVLWISSPALLFLLILRIIAGLPNFRSWLQGFDMSLQIDMVYTGTLVLVVLVISTIIMTAISKIEQTVWLDSYFDGKNLTPQESWKIAKRLYIPWCKLQSKLFFRYYVWIVVTIIALFFSAIFFTSNFARSLPGNFIMIGWSSLIIIGGITLVILTRYFKLKLSYAPFIFLDKYTGDTSPEFWKEFFIELETLNKASEGESFKKNVMLEIGADVAVSLTQFIAQRMTAVLGPTAGIFLLAGKEVAIRIIYYAKKTGQYVLYRFAFKTIHGDTHYVNEYIYNLSK